jgi:hypothetical protein
MRLHVSGPRWIRVAVHAAIVADESAAADRLIADLRAAITRFLHPLTGGELGQGWDFGRIPRRSHLYRLLARFPGVHRIDALAVVTDPPLPDASEPLTEPQRRALAGALVYSGAHELTLAGHAEDPDHVDPLTDIPELQFDDLVAAARARLPSLCPAWTDHGPADLGVTLIELFAAIARCSATGPAARPRR